MAAVELWGVEDQMLMVAEEGVELAHAVMKWRRAWKKYNKAGISLTREGDSIEASVETQAHQRYLVKMTENLRKEAMQTLYMIDQLQVMHPGDYEGVLEEVLADAAQKLRNRGVEI